MDLRELIEALEQAPVNGPETEGQEGMRYIAVSVPAMDMIIEWLEAADNIINEIETLEQECNDMDKARTLN